MKSNRNAEGIYRLSPQQQGMLFETLRTAHSGVFVEQEVQTIRSAIDLRAFEAAWRRMIDRHAILRTAFVWKSRPELLQVVFDTVDLPIEYQDLRRASPTEQRLCLQRYLEADRARGFDLTRAPLFRVALFRMRDDRCDLVWTQHHILYDGWCRPLLFQELVSFYAAYAQGAQPPRVRARPYSDYVAWVEKQDLRAAELFWRKELEGFRSPSRLGTVIAPMKGVSPSGGHAEIERRHSAAQTGLLETLARQWRVTVSAVLHAAWALLLARYNDADDVVFGSTVAGRPADLPGVESIIGPFITTLPFRVRIDCGRAVSEWVSRVQAAHATIRRFEYCSAGQVQQWSEVPAGASLYESVLVFENYPSTSSRDRQVTLGGSNDGRFIGGRTPYTLTLLATPGTELNIRALFRTERIGWAAVSRILDHLGQILRHIVARPAESIRELLDGIAEDSIPQVYAASIRAVESADSAPANPVEQRLAAAACDVLGVPRVSMTERFLDLGGHSLVAIQLLSRLRNDLQIEIPLRVVFESADLRELAQQLEAAIRRKVESFSDEEAARLLSSLSADVPPHGMATEPSSKQRQHLGL
jgi:acyl carrier protein